VNTKSAGLKSFFKKHFENIGGEEVQDKFNHYWMNEFENMAMKMHQEAGILYCSGFEQWESDGLETLPGKLAPEYKKFLLITTDL